MALPKALQNADEEANELIRQQQQKASTPETGNTDEPQQPQENRTPEQPPQQPPQSDSEQTWEHKYRVLQGKYNADIKKLNDDLREAQQRSQDPSLQRRLQSLETENTQLKQQLEQQQQSSANPSGEVKLNKTLVDEYGEDFARAVAEQASAGNSGTSAEIQRLSNLVNSLQSKLTQTEQATNETAGNMRMRELNAELSKSNIDFEQVNTDPMFHEWLKGIDEASGEERNTLMNGAFSRGDINRTAFFFKAFKAQERSNFSNNPLASQVDVSSRAPGDAMGDDNVWTKEQINRLYDDYNKGKLTEGEFKEWERKLFAAHAAGNVID